MMRPLSIVLLLAICASAFGAQLSLTTDKFVGVELSLPLGSFVNVSSDNSFSVSINATEQQLATLNPYVDSAGILRVDTKDGQFFPADWTALEQMRVLVPAGSLSSFRLIGTGTFGIDGSAISNTAPLNISKDGSGSMAIKNVDVPSVNVISVGSGQFVVSGKLGDVSYNAWDKSLTGQNFTDDKSSAFFVGDISSVSLKLNGLGAVSFKASGSPSITGSVNSNFAVSYNQGTCDVTKTGSGSSRVCQQGPIRIALPGYDIVGPPTLAPAYTSGLVG